MAVKIVKSEETVDRRQLRTNTVVLLPNKNRETRPSSGSSPAASSQQPQHKLAEQAAAQGAEQDGDEDGGQETRLINIR